MSADVTAQPELKGLQISVRFAGVTALSEVDVSLRRGEIVGLIGPNGAGKSTLLNVLAGALQPTTGRVVLNGRRVTARTPYSLARAGVARTFQGLHLFQGLTVLENVEVALVAARRLRRSVATARAREIMSELGLSHRADELASALPYGEEQRVALARAVASEPDFLLLDEPAAGLNEEETAELAETIRGVYRQLGCAVMVVEHDIPFIMGLCERIQVLDVGRTIASGSPREVQADPAVIAAYLGRTPETAQARVR
jgi:branched-chain amino acid transport system ATP-binding protein